MHLQVRVRFRWGIGFSLTEYPVVRFKVEIL
jgi:hypothetical protein